MRVVLYPTGSTLAATFAPSYGGIGGSGPSAGYAVTNEVDVTPTGGTAPYSYSWSTFSTDGGITTTSPTASGTTFKVWFSSNPPNPLIIGRATCTVTDATGATTQITCNLSFQYASGGGGGNPQL